MAVTGRLVAKNLSMVFSTKRPVTRVEALQNVSFTFDQGDFVVILGPSGCGKTTLLNIAAGFLSPTSGEMSLDGAPITGPGPERGVVFQKGALFEWMNVRKNVDFGLRMRNVAEAKRNEVVDDLLEKVGLSGFADTHIYQLSGGMQQRVALARCLANDPKLILMDEPLGALDALTREKMQSLLLKLWRDSGKTIVLITHSVEEALLLGQRLIVMAPRPGRIEEQHQLPFAEQAIHADSRTIKASAPFIEWRERILSTIWEMQEEIMGNKGA